MASKTFAPWAIPNPLPRGSSSSLANVHTAVGAALSRWEVIENLLVSLFADLTGLKFELALVVYGSLNTSVGKRLLIQETGKYTLQKKKHHFEYLNKIINEVAQASGRRNQIAHGIANTFQNGPLLIPPYHIGKQNNRVKRTWDFCFTDDHIMEYAKNFDYLANEIRISQYLLRDEPVPPSLPQTPFEPLFRPCKNRLRTPGNQATSSPQP